MRELAKPQSVNLDAVVAVVVVAVVAIYFFCSLLAPVTVLQPELLQTVPRWMETKSQGIFLSCSIEELDGRNTVLFRIVEH